MTVDLHAQNQDESAYREGPSALDKSPSDLSTALRDIFDRGHEPAPMTEEAERDLIDRAQRLDDSATIALLYQYSPLLRNAVGADHGNRSIAEDLRAAAVAGVIEAIFAFDLGGDGRRLGDLAVRRVHANVDQVSALESPIGVPDRTLRRFYGILSRAGGDVQRGAELADEFHMSRETFLSIASARYLVEFPEDVQPYIEQGYGDIEDHDMAQRARAGVGGLERRVIDYRYGFATGEPLSQQAIADVLSREDVGTYIYQQKIDRLEKSAIDRMRDALAIGEVPEAASV